MITFTPTTEGKYREILFQAAADRGGLLLQPRLLVYHYTAGASMQSDTDALTKADDRYVSSHFLVGRDGACRQFVSTKFVAWHAGKSVFEGKSGCNAFSIGIEMTNWGALKKRGDKFYAWPSDYSKVVIPESEVVEAKHRNPNCKERFWHRYPAAQIEAARTLGAVLFRDIVSLRAVAGHEEISPDRKIDPGPAFPLDDVRDFLMAQFNR